MKPARWTPHALKNLEDREIDRASAEATLNNPEFVTDGGIPRKIYMRRYNDAVLKQPMLLRLVVEETQTERVVIAAYKTSQISRYLKGLIP